MSVERSIWSWDEEMLPEDLKVGDRPSFEEVLDHIRTHRDMVEIMFILQPQVHSRHTYYGHSWSDSDTTIHDYSHVDESETLWLIEEFKRSIYYQMFELKRAKIESIVPF